MSLYIIIILYVNTHTLHTSWRTVCVSQKVLHIHLEMNSIFTLIVNFCSKFCISYNFYLNEDNYFGKQHIKLGQFIKKP